MDINAEKGHKIIVTNETMSNGYLSDVELVKKHLKVGKIYTVEYTALAGWCSKVYIKEVPNIAFNTVNFKDADIIAKSISSKNIKLSMLADGKLHPDIEKIIRYTIKEWSSLREREDPTHEELVQRWLDSNCKEWIKNNLNNREL